MKNIFIISLFCFMCFFSKAQSCDSLTVDLVNGTINGLEPTASQEQVKEKFPCSTGDTEDGSDFNCGGGVFFLDHDFFFYTGNDYIEIRRNFKGIISTDLLGLSRDEAIKKPELGEISKQVTDGEGDFFKEFLFFKTTYGCIRLNIVDGKVDAVAVHAKPAEEVKLCL